MSPEGARGSPRDRAEAAAAALGGKVLTRWCADLLTGAAAYGATGDPDPHWLAGPLVDGWGSPGRLDGAEHAYWVRVWAARTLLHVWDDECAPAVVLGLGDEAWRVREMCAKVAARWEVGEAADAAARLAGDEVPRVRAAGVRVVGAVGEHEHLRVLLSAQDDAQAVVRTAATRALSQLSQRLDLTDRP